MVLHIHKYSASLSKRWGRLKAVWTMMRNIQPNASMMVSGLVPLNTSLRQCL